jgi:hypothetical protein
MSCASEKQLRASMKVKNTHGKNTKKKIEAANNRPLFGSLEIKVVRNFWHIPLSKAWRGTILIVYWKRSKSSKFMKKPILNRTSENVRNEKLFNWKFWLKLLKLLPSIDINNKNIDFSSVASSFVLNYSAILNFQEKVFE